MVRKFTLALWIANGLVQRCQELKKIIVKHNLDIILISKKHSFDFKLFRIPKCTLYTTNHNLKTSLLLHFLDTEIKYYPLEIDISYNELIQFTSYVYYVYRKFKLVITWPT